MNIDLLANLNKNRYIRNFQRDIKLIRSIVIVLLFWSIVYLILFHKPLYESVAQVWIKDLETKEFVTDLDRQSQLSSLTSAGNPLLTQIEILKSDKLKKIIAEHKLTKGEKASPNDIKIEVKNKINTDILTISLKEKTPELAQETLNVVLEEYDNINLSINNKISKSRREYIDLKLDEINEKLYEIRSQIKEYKKETLAIDLSEESMKLVDQGINMSSKMEEVNAQIKNNQSSIKSLEKQLSLNSKTALNAVALGSGNKLLEQLRQDLNTAVQEYEFDSTKLADTNPKMVAQKNKINTINKQIKNQITLSIGNYAKSQKINIFDPVREDLVKSLVDKQTELMGYQAEEKAIKNSIKKINKIQSEMPEKKFMLDTLEQEEKALSSAYDQLKEKQIEAKIKEAEGVSNVIVVDAPSLPLGQSFPSRIQVLLIAVIFGLFTGLSVSIIKTLIEDVCDDVEAIEEITGASVIGTIPWLENYFPDEQMQFVHGVAYDNIVSNLMIKCFKNKTKVLTFTSSSLQKPQSTVLYYLATRLKKLGHSVVIIDSDFRIPTMFKDADIQDKVKINLSDLIVNFENKLQQGETIIPKEIENVLVADNKDIFHLGNKEIVFEPYEFFGTSAFEEIIKTLKNKFNWVLIDTGAAHITPEFLIISKLADGVVLFVNKTITYSVIKNITKSLKNASIPFIGTIVREASSRLEREYEKYLRFQENKMLNEQNTDSFI